MDVRCQRTSRENKGEWKRLESYLVTPVTARISVGPGPPWLEP